MEKKKTKEKKGIIFIFYFAPLFVASFLFGLFFSQKAREIFEIVLCALQDNLGIFSLIPGLAFLAILFFGFFGGIIYATGAVTSSLGESYEENGQRYLEITASRNEIHAEEKEGYNITRAGILRFFMWLTYPVWCVPLYIKYLVRKIKKRNKQSF